MSSYNEIHYPTHVYPETHPDTLARTAILFGMRPPPVNRCRVLEIGCGDGGNLIPMAFELPNSELVGIDLAAGPILDGQRVIERTGVRNVSLRVMDVMDIDPSFGRFDYIIAHGIYSWVPADVQNKILATCRNNLSQSGVAFISFNTYPGGHLRQAARDVMMFHLRTTAISNDRVREGRKLLRTILDIAEGNAVWQAMLKEEVDRLSKRPDNVVFHDELSPVYSPVYFSEFAAAAEQNGLQFVSEVKLSDVIDPVRNTKTADILRRLGKDVISYQQYLDYTVFREFRRTLVCHREVQLDRDHLLEHVQTLLVASPLLKAENKNNNEVSFTNRRGAGTITTDNPVLSLALSQLQRTWPHATRFSDLVSQARIQLPAFRDEIPMILAQAILKLAASRLADLRTYDVPVANCIGERPATTSLARLQAEEGNLVTTLLHTNVDISQEQTRQLLQLLDGTRTTAALTSAIMSVGDRMSTETTRKGVRTVLEDFRQMGLLVTQ